MRVKLDLLDLESTIIQLKNLLFVIDECFASLKQIQGELSQDQAMLLLPETYIAMDALEHAVGECYLLFGRADELKSVLSNAPEDLARCEKFLREKLDRLTLNIKYALVRSGAVASAYSAGVLPLLPQTSRAELPPLFTGEDCTLKTETLAAIESILSSEFDDMKAGL